jgi:hypothetical protein
MDFHARSAVLANVLIERDRVAERSDRGDAAARPTPQSITLTTGEEALSWPFASTPPATNPLGAALLFPTSRHQAPRRTRANHFRELAILTKPNLKVPKTLFMRNVGGIPAWSHSSSRRMELAGHTLRKGGIGQSSVSEMARRSSASFSWIMPSAAMLAAQALRTAFFIWGVPWFRRSRAVSIF